MRPFGDFGNTGRAIGVPRTAHYPLTMTPNMESRWRKVWSFFLRLTAAVAVLSTVYVVAGSILYPDWWFEYFWRGGFSDPSASAAALNSEVQEYPLSSLVVVFLFCALCTLIGKYKRVILPLIDRRWGWFVSGSAFTVVGVALIVCRFAGPSYTAWEQVVASISRDISRRQSEGPNVVPPIDFLYLDSTRMDRLFNEIEPELIEKARTVGSTHSGGAKAEIGGPALSADLGVSTSEALTSAFERARFLPERECIKVMQYVIENHNAQYYTDSDRWVAMRTMPPLPFETSRIDESKVPIEAYLNEADAIEEQAIATISRKLAATPGGLQHLSRREREEVERRVKINQQEMTRELKSLKGLVFVEGEFAASPRPNGMELLHNFSAKPLRIVFRVVLPRNFALKDLPSNGAARLTVFGVVERPLSSDGILEVRPLAVY